MRMMGASLRSARYRTCGSTQVSAATSASGRLEHDLRDRDADDGSGGTPTCPSQSLTNMSKPNIVHRGEFTFRGSCSGADSDVATIQHGHLELGRAPGHGCDHCRRIEPHEYIGDQGRVTQALSADRGSDRRTGEWSVANPIAPVVVELAIAFGDCDGAPMGR